MDNPQPPGDIWSKRRWLSRLSFSFLVVAMFLGYTAYKGAQSHLLSQGRVTLYYAIAGVSFVLFLMGTREKHRPRDEE